MSFRISGADTTVREASAGPLTLGSFSRSALTQHIPSIYQAYPHNYPRVGSPLQEAALDSPELRMKVRVRRGSKTMFLFSQPIITSAQHIAWAAGPCHAHAIPNRSAAEGTTQPLMYAFCLPGHESFPKTSAFFMCSAMSFYVHSEYGSCPFGSHKLILNYVIYQDVTQMLSSATVEMIVNI